MYVIKLTESSVWEGAIVKKVKYNPLIHFTSHINPKTRVRVYLDGLNVTCLLFVPQKFPLRATQRNNKNIREKDSAPKTAHLC